MKINKINHGQLIAKFVSQRTTQLSTQLATFCAATFCTFTLFALPAIGSAENSNYQNEVTENKDSLQISSEAYQNIQSFFDSSIDLIIQRHNRQLLNVKLGARSFLASNDGRYLFVGKVIDTKNKVDVSEQIAQRNRVLQLSKIGDKNHLNFSSTIKELFSVTLFTDIDCGYCRRFHNDMAQYNALGISVNYVMLPRAGKNSQSYEKTLAVLCDVNPQESMTLAMQGKTPTVAKTGDKKCKQSLDQQMLLAADFGITATPTLLLPSGAMIKGVLSPQELLAKLQQFLPSESSQ